MSALDDFEDFFRLRPEMLKAHKEGRTRLSAILESAVAGDRVSAGRLIDLAAEIFEKKEPLVPELQDHFARAFKAIRNGDDPAKALGINNPANRKTTETSRDLAIALRVRELITNGTFRTQGEVFKAVAKEFWPKGEKKVATVKDVHYRLGKVAEEYEEYWPEMRAALDEEMAPSMERVMRILHPAPVNEALDLIEDESVILDSETYKRLKQLEEATLPACKEMLEIENRTAGEQVCIDASIDAKYVTKMYWHGHKDIDNEGNEQEVISAFYPPLWTRYVNNKNARLKTE